VGDSKVSPTNHFPTEKPLKFHLVMVKGVDVRMMWLKRNLLQWAKMLKVALCRP